MRRIADHWLTLTVVVFAGVSWAIYQGLMRLLIGDLDDDSVIRSCPPIEHSEVVYTAVTVGACAAALAALGFGLARRPAAALAAIGVEVVFAVAWFALGGDRAAGCVIGI